MSVEKEEKKNKQLCLQHFFLIETFIFDRKAEQY